jgi:Ca-activated chloride channel family protein
LDFGKLQAKDIYPYPLPDLFVGGQIAVVGRYSHGGITDVTLRGESNGIAEQFIYPNLEFAQQSPYRDQAQSKIPILWATRKIGYLLQEIRLNGADREIIDEIVQLSIRYGIVTPYTSYLVTEPAILGVEERERVVTEELQKFNDLAQLPTFGRAAVEQAEGQNSLASAEAVPVAPQGVQTKVRTVDMHTFVNSEGVWVDTRFDPQLMEPIMVEFLSEQYFSLARTNPWLAQAFALGPEVIVLSGDKVYEIIDEVPKKGTNPDPNLGMKSQSTPQSNGSPEFQNQSSTDERPVPSQLPCLNGLVISIFPLVVLSFSTGWRLLKNRE